jgi:hypothetical protein
MKAVERSVSQLILIAMLSPVLIAQQPKDVLAAPVPPQIVSAKRVFISNAGVDGLSLATFERMGEPNKPYNQFYAAMKNWGHYELVSAPSDADLVFEIRFGAPLMGSDKLNTYAPQYVVTILDTKTHFTLWTLGEPVQGAFRKTTMLKNLDQAVDKVMGDLKRLAGPASASTEAQK